MLDAAAGWRSAGAWTRVSEWVRARGEALTPLLPESREAALRTLVRLHLMLFFLHGRCVSEHDEQRPGLAWRGEQERVVGWEAAPTRLTPPCYPQVLQLCAAAGGRAQHVCEARGGAASVVHGDRRVHPPGARPEGLGGRHGDRQGGAACTGEMGR
jgi:hypothetical protein